MNARTLYQRLLRNRVRNLWGSRAYLTVRIPLASLPPRPPFTPPGERNPEGSGWLRTVNGVKECIRISSFSTGGDPRLHRKGHFYNVHEERLSSPDDQWWQASEVRVHRGYGDGKGYVPEDLHPTGWEDLDPAEAEPLAAAHGALNDWFATYLEVNGDTGIAALDALHAAAHWAKTTYCFINGPYAYLTYSVKWFYRYRAEEVAKGVARALKVCKASGFPVKIMRGAPGHLM
jgi:hypothetical protein